MPHTSAVSATRSNVVWCHSLFRSLEPSRSSSDSEFYLCPAIYIHKILCHHGSLYEERLCVIFMKFHLAPGSSCLLPFPPQWSTHENSSSCDKFNKEVFFYATLVLFEGGGLKQGEVAACGALCRFNQQHFMFCPGSKKSMTVIDVKCQAEIAGLCHCSTTGFRMFEYNQCQKEAGELEPSRTLVLYGYLYLYGLPSLASPWMDVRKTPSKIDLYDVRRRPW